MPELTGEGPPIIPTPITTEIRGQEYEFTPQNQPQKESIDLMVGLQEGKRSLGELTYQQLQGHAVELMRYQMVAAFNDDKEDEWASETFIAAQQEALPVFTEYRDQDGNIKKAEVMTEEESEPKISKTDLARAENLMKTTHKGIIRQTLTEIIQHMADSQHQFGDDVSYSKDTAQMYLTISQIIRDEAENKVAPLEADLPDFLKGTHKFNMDILPFGDIVVGEKHIRMFRNDSYERLFISRIDSLGPDCVMVLENPQPQLEIPGYATDCPTFQQLAFSEAEKRNLTTEILDDKHTSGIILTSEALSFWETFGFSQEETVFRHFTGAAKIAVEKLMVRQGLTSETLASELSNITKEGVLSSFPELTNKLCQWYTDTISQEGGYQKIEKFLYASIFFVESKMREDYFARKLKEIKKKTPKAKIFLVVGDAHREILRASLLSQGDSSIFTDHYKEFYRAELQKLNPPLTV